MLLERNVNFGIYFKAFMQQKNICCYAVNGSWKYLAKPYKNAISINIETLKQNVSLIA